MGSINISKSVLESIVRSIVEEIGVVPVPLFDYVVEIYADKVVVTSRGGKVTVLASVAELNSWLKGVRDKRIVVFSHARVEDAIVLTRNMYVFAKGWYSYIALAETVELYFFGDYVDSLDNAPVEANMKAYVDVSGSRLFIMNAGSVVLYGNEEVRPLRNMTAVCIGCNSVHMNGFNRGVVVLSSVDVSIVSYSVLDVLAAVGLHIFIAYGTTVARVLRLRATFTSLSNVTFAGASVAVDAGTSFVRNLKPSGQAGDTATVAVPLITVASDYIVSVEVDVNVYVAQCGGPAVRLNLCYLEPAGNRVSCSVDLSTATITVKNNTDSDITVVVRVRLVSTGVARVAASSSSENNTGASHALINTKSVEREKEESLISAQLNV